MLVAKNFPEGFRAVFDAPQSFVMEVQRRNSSMGEELWTSPHSIEDYVLILRALSKLSAQYKPEGVKEPVVLFEKMLEQRGLWGPPSFRVVQGFHGPDHYEEFVGRRLHFEFTRGSDYLGNPQWKSFFQDTNSKKQLELASALVHYLGLEYLSLPEED